MLQRLKGLLDKLQWSHVILIVGGGAAFFYFMQDTADLEAKEAGVQAEITQIATLEKKIEEAKEFERQFEEKKKRYADLVKSLQNLKEALPRQFFLPDLLSDILREAKQLELEVTTIRPDPKETQGELYNTLGIGLSARGTFLQYFIFIDRLAHMSRLINVESFSVGLDARRPSMTLGGEGGEFANSGMAGGAVTFPGIMGNIRINAYRYRGGAAASGTPAAGGKP